MIFVEFNIKINDMLNLYYKLLFKKIFLSNLINKQELKY